MEFIDVTFKVFCDSEEPFTYSLLTLFVTVAHLL